MTAPNPQQIQSRNERLNTSMARRRRMSGLSRFSARHARQSKRERRARARSVERFDAPAVRANDFLRQGEAEADTGRAAGTRGLAAIEALEDMRQILVADAGAFVGHADDRF